MIAPLKAISHCDLGNFRHAAIRMDEGRGLIAYSQALGESARFSTESSRCVVWLRGLRILHSPSTIDTTVSCCSRLLEQLQKRHSAATRALRSSTRLGRDRSSYSEQVLGEATQLVNHAAPEPRAKATEAFPLSRHETPRLGQVPSSTALPTTDELLDAAISARDAGVGVGDGPSGPVSGSSTRIRVGAALLTSSGKVFTAGAVPSTVLATAAGGPFEGSLPVLFPAERACLLNALSHGEHDFRAMFLVSNSSDDFVMPSAASVAELAAHGDFAVYVAKADRTMTRYTTAELAATAALALDDEDGGQGIVQTAGNQTLEFSASAAAKNVVPPQGPPADWTTADVCDWLTGALLLPQYASAFDAASVDGPLLLSLSDADLRDLIGITHALHRRKIHQAVERLLEAGKPGGGYASRCCNASLAQPAKCGRNGH